MATFPTGQTVTASLTATVKASGRIKIAAIVNGQTSSSKATLSFVSEHGFSQTVTGGEAVGFADLNGTTLTLNLLVHLDSGEIIKEVTILQRTT